MNPILKLSLREILRHRGFALFFAFNLALGLIGFALLDAFKISLERSVHERSKNLLSADLAISARRELNPDEQSLVARDLPSGTRQGEVITT